MAGPHRCARRARGERASGGQPEVEHRQLFRQALEPVDLDEVAAAEDAGEVAVAAAVEAAAEGVDAAAGELDRRVELR